MQLRNLSSAHYGRARDCPQPHPTASSPRPTANPLPFADICVQCSVLQQQSLWWQLVAACPWGQWRQVAPHKCLVCGKLSFCPRITLEVENVLVSLPRQKGVTQTRTELATLRNDESSGSFVSTSLASDDSLRSGGGYHVATFDMSLHLANASLLASDDAPLAADGTPSG